MTALLLSTALVAATALAFVHGHALGLRRGEAEAFAFLEAEARRVTAGGDA